jgi:glycosyltransferase involved in cell wall biosynthesis
MKITLILKDNLNRRPPVLSVCHHLADLGYALTIITCGVSDYTRKEFEKKGTLIKLYNGNPILCIIPVIGKIIKWLQFRSAVTHILKKTDSDYVWVGSADAAIAMGRMLFKYKYILQIQELYDLQPIYRKRLCKLMKNAEKVFVPEKTRAHIFRAWYQLDETPVVLPNKPNEHPRRRGMEITEPLAKAAFDKIPNGSKIVFYQGGISDRRDLKPIAKAIQELGPPWVLAVQSPIDKNAYYNDFIKNYKFYYIPYVAAPKHLEITSNVHLGLVTYSHVSMNNEFCAPNKIWEYSGFGLPMIANDVKGLVDTVGRYDAGICLNLDHANIASIKQALLELDGNLEKYRRNCSALYDSVDNQEVIRQALSNFVNKNKINKRYDSN